MNFADEQIKRLRVFSKSLDQGYGNVPKEMEIPLGDFYAVFKRSNKGANYRILMGLPKTEAIFWASSFNQREIDKRKSLNNQPEEVWFFDCVKEGTNEEEVYWNPSELFI